MNSTDRILRVIDAANGDIIQSFQDTVGRLNWTCCGLGTTSNFLAAGPSDVNAHRLFIWEADSGILLKVLQGPSEGILDIAVVEEGKG